jgi:transposase
LDCSGFKHYFHIYIYTYIYLHTCRYVCMYITIYSYIPPSGSIDPWFLICFPCFLSREYSPKGDKERQGILLHKWVNFSGTSSRMVLWIFSQHLRVFRSTCQARRSKSAEKLGANAEGISNMFWHERNWEKDGRWWNMIHEEVDFGWTWFMTKMRKKLRKLRKNWEQVLHGTKSL